MSTDELAQQRKRALMDENLHDRIAPHLQKIAAMFKNPRITLLVRNPDLDDGDVIMSQDTMPDAIAALQKTWGRQ